MIVWRCMDLFERLIKVKKYLLNLQSAHNGIVPELISVTMLEVGKNIIIDHAIYT